MLDPSGCINTVLLVLLPSPLQALAIGSWLTCCYSIAPFMTKSLFLHCVNDLLDNMTLATATPDDNAHYRHDIGQHRHC
ncbi:predicted protein [Lichtheimia corymbifera JMRC:FSU:9682]|uniref:Secreted protein n=1 Tax=Lichtheimia corymbifera JMRC:FSU:9682 TaxID=1263082 RepID=A0A068RUH1_9FUNG|nr:predicted protein [Lichtheimia corymbifera JMRC:FSU:9682]